MTARRYGSRKELYCAMAFVLNRQNIAQTKEELATSAREGSAHYGYAVRVAAFLEAQKISQARRLKGALHEEEPSPFLTLPLSNRRP